MTTGSSSVAAVGSRSNWSEGVRSLLQSMASRQGLVRVITSLWIVCVLFPVLGLVVISMMVTKGITIVPKFSLGEYANILGGYRLNIILRTLRITFMITLIEFVLAFPFALWLAKGLRNGWTKTIILVLLVVPFFLSPAARTFVWRPILGREGLVNAILLATGLVDHPLDWLLFSEFSIDVGLIGPYFPSMVWPLYISLALIDDELINASRDLGASEWDTLRMVILPLAAPGIVAGVIFTAIPMLGDNVVLVLLGGRNVTLVAEVIDDMVGSLDWPGAAAMASIIFALVAIIMLMFAAVLKRTWGSTDIFGNLRL
jgi:ABC-type spermidine/putrescine transport system permease subunit I